MAASAEGLPRGLQEECGVFGVAGSKKAAAVTRLGLHSLQHRGQDGAGIVSWNNGQGFNDHKKLGLVSSVFNKECMDRLTGSLAIGHVRYGTTGASGTENVQPLCIDLKSHGKLWVAHNGNIVNYPELRSTLEGMGRKFATTSDTEIMLHLVAMSNKKLLPDKISDACLQLHGSFSSLFLSQDQLVAIRDPYGIRPLSMGTGKDGALVIASETCALDQVDASFDREIKPGEMVVVSNASSPARSVSPVDYYKQPLAPKHCLFELIYLASPCSYAFGQSVYRFRHACGETLAKEAPPPPPLSSDIIVVPVPESAIPAAIGYSKASGLPYEHGLDRSQHIVRTFIEDVQEKREEMVAMKLAPVRNVIAGKRLMLVDDSLVRGTTSTIVVRRLREAGAREVHLRIASPKVIDVCYYGVNISTKEELALAKDPVEVVCKNVGADSLQFLSLESIQKILGGKDHFCNACFTGKHLKDVSIKEW